MKTVLPAILVFLGVLWTGVPMRTAQATPYEYGVALDQKYVYNVPNQSKSTMSCFPIPNSCTGVISNINNGTPSITNSQNVGGNGTELPGSPLPGLSGSGSLQNKAQVTLGAIHLSSSTTTTGSAGGIAYNQASWVDVLTVGNNFSSGTPIQFAVNLDLSGYVDSSANKGANLDQQAGAMAEAVSNFILLPSPSDPASINLVLSGSLGSIFNLGGIQNDQQLCVYQNNNACSKYYSNSPKNFSTVLTAYPGETFIVEDNLTSTASSNGGYSGNMCSIGTCYTYTTGAADSYFLDTALFTMTPITTGAFYTTASGVSYLGFSPGSGGISDTPEPTGGLLFLTGLVGLAVWSRKTVLWQPFPQKDCKERAWLRRTKIRHPTHPLPNR